MINSNNSIIIIVLVLLTLLAVGCQNNKTTKTTDTWIEGYPDPPRSIEEECWCRMHFTVACLRFYESQHGVFPSDVKKGPDLVPEWVSVVRESKVTQKVYGDRLWQVTKCPCDNTKEVTSYEFPLANKSLKSIPQSEWASTPILKEKKFDGSHGHVLYLNYDIGSSNE